MQRRKVSVESNDLGPQITENKSRPRGNVMMDIENQDMNKD